MPTQFFAVITAAGLAELAAAVSGSYLLNFSEIRVGDGNGAYHNPGGSITHFASNGLGGTRVTSPDHDLVDGEIIDISGTSNYDSLPLHFTVSNANIGAGTFDINIAFTVDDAIGQWNRLDLVHQVWPVSGLGGPINAVYVHPDHANWLVIEGYIPAAEGGFTVREVALISPGISGDVVFSVGMVPVSEKPVIANGSVKDLYFRMILVTSDVANITLVVDPNVILATQTYVQLFAKWASETERLITGVSFEGSVNQGDAAYYNPSTNKFGQAIADGTIKQRVLGFADVSHCCIIRGGYFPWPSPSLTPGSIYYLSTTVLGGITTTPPTRYTVEMGVALSASVMDVMVDDILSAYEDRAMTFDSLGDVGFLRSITVALDIIAGNNITAGALVQSPNINVFNQLAVGSAGGFPAFLVSNEGDINVTGGIDGIWGLVYLGLPVIRILSDVHLQFYDVDVGVYREMKQTSSSNAIVCAKNDGKIDSSFLPGGGITVFPNTYKAPWGVLFPEGYIQVGTFNWPNFEEIMDFLTDTINVGFITDYLVNGTVVNMNYTVSVNFGPLVLQMRLKVQDIQHGVTTYSAVHTFGSTEQFTFSIVLPVSNRIRLCLEHHASDFYSLRKDVTPGITPIYFGYDLP